MRLFVLSLFISGFFYSSAASQEASLASEDLPFDFIPNAFQGHWIITGFHYPPESENHDIEPEQYISKEIIIGNNRLNIFGHECIVLGFDMNFEKIAENEILFNSAVISDAGIKKLDPQAVSLHLNTCENRTVTKLIGDDIKFKARKTLSRYPLLTKYQNNEYKDFMILNYPQGPQFILHATQPTTYHEQEIDSKNVPDKPLSFDFIPKMFQGHWVITKFHYPPIYPMPVTPPEPYVGKEIIIRNDHINIFGYECHTSNFRMFNSEIRKDDVGFLRAGNTLFDRRAVPDPDIKDYYPYDVSLHVRCASDFFIGMTGEDRKFFDADSPSYASISFGKYQDSEENEFIALTYPNGPEFILRPVIDD